MSAIFGPACVCVAGRRRPINGTSKVPDKKGSDSKATKGTPPRNAVYVFQFMPAQGQFSDVAKTDLFVQGYNRAETSGKFPKGPAFIPANPDGTQDYYAGYQPNVLGGVLNEKPCAVGDPCGSTIATVDLQMVKGKICNTSAPLKNSPGPGKITALAKGNDRSLNST